MIATVLFAPPQGDPQELMRPDACGGRPPLAWRCASRVRGVLCGAWQPHGAPLCGVCHGAASNFSRYAIALIWAGQPLKHSIERLHRAWLGHGMGMPTSASDRDWNLAARTIAGDMDRGGLGTALFYDIGRREA